MRLVGKCIKEDSSEEVEVVIGFNLKRTQIYASGGVTDLFQEILKYSPMSFHMFMHMWLVCLLKNILRLFFNDSR